MLKFTYGTAALLNTGETPVVSKNRLTTIAHQLGASQPMRLKVRFQLAVQWLRDGLQNHR
jgi:glycerol kinase